VVEVEAGGAYNSRGLVEKGVFNVMKEFKIRQQRRRVCVAGLGSRANC
jgi:hypothetical protein